VIRIKSWKYIKLAFLTLMTVTTLITVGILAYLVFREDINKGYIVGEVDVEIEAFYEKDGIIQTIELDQVGGVVELNITDPNQLEHFNNFRVNIKVYSSVYTYLRVAVFEQFTLTYMTGEQKTIVAVVKDGFSSFAYNEDFYDNRLEDGFFYYKNKVKRNGDNSPLIVEFIGELPADDYHPIYESKYTLQVGFVVEAVQYLEGPKINWGLANPPWKEEEEW